jgi:dihydroxyacetone kinase phosphoprotein-dependent L subunit
MTMTHISAMELREMLAYTGKRIEAEEPALTALDSAIGDGDHGITMRLGFQAIKKATAGLPENASISSVLTTAGNAFMGGTGGAIGVILGRALIAGGKALADAQQIGPEEFKTMLCAMEEGVVKVGRAKPGDKTLLDALHAAVVSLATTSGNDSLEKIASRAADAGETGAQGTADIPCRLGRASRLGDRALGHRDPGAVSFSLILRAMSDWINGKGAY